MPDEVQILAPTALLLPGEHLEHYQLLQQAILADLDPQSAIEWLLAFDVAELSWEIRRYRMLRHKVLESYRDKAIEQALLRIDSVGIAPDFQDQAEYFTAQNALSWRRDPLAASEIEHRLATYGFDQHAISTEVYAQARDIFMLFESLLNSAQARRLVLLREIKSNRKHCPNTADRKGHLS